MSKKVLTETDFQSLMNMRKFICSMHQQSIQRPVDYSDEMTLLLCKHVQYYKLPLSLTTDQELPKTIEILITFLTDRQIYGTAFGFSVLTLYLHPITLTRENMAKAIALRKKVQGDMAMYKKELKGFEEFLVTTYRLREFTSETVFPVLDMFLDEIHYQYLGKTNEKSVSDQVEIYWMYVRKHLDLKVYFPEGVCNFRAPQIT